MKHLLLTTIAAVLLFGFGKSQLSSAATEETPVADAVKSEPATANSTILETPSTLAKSQEAEFNRQTSLGRDIATNLAAITGIAISPLFGMSAVSCYMYYGTPISQRQNLPWYNSPSVWGAGFFFWFLFLVNTQIGTAVPLLKKPMDTVELFENKISAIIAQPALMSQLYTFGAGLAGLSAAKISAASAHGPLLASIALPGELLGILTAGLGFIAFAAVWLCSHTINVFILISPWGGVDNVLRLVRGGLITAVFGSFFVPVIGPFLCIAICLIIIAASCFLAPWAFRLMVFGSTCAWDFLTFRHKRFKPESSPIRAFVLKPFDDIPKRTYGSLSRDSAGSLIFTYRNWLVLPKKTALIGEGEHYAEKGIFSPALDALDSETGRSPSLFRFPPRYRGHENYIVETLALKGVLDEPIFKGLRNAWRWLKHRLGVEEEIPTASPAPVSSG